MLCRIANPFLDFYTILVVGVANSSMTEAARARCEDKQVRDHAKDLWVKLARMGCAQLTPHSTPIQHKIYSEDFVQITSNLPFLTKRLESDDPSRVIRKIVHKVRACPSKATKGDTAHFNFRSNQPQIRPNSWTQRGSRMISFCSSRKHIFHPTKMAAWQ